MDMPEGRPRTEEARDDSVAEARRQRGYIRLTRIWSVGTLLFSANLWGMFFIALFFPASEQPGPATRFLEPVFRWFRDRFDLPHLWVLVGVLLAVQLGLILYTRDRWGWRLFFVSAAIAGSNVLFFLWLISVAGV